MPFSAEKPETGQINSATANINACAAACATACAVFACEQHVQGLCLYQPCDACSSDASYRQRKTMENYGILFGALPGLDTAGTLWFERPHVASSCAPSPRPRHSPPPASSPVCPRIVLGSTGANKPFRPVTSSDFYSHLQSIKSI